MRNEIGGCGSQPGRPMVVVTTNKGVLILVVVDVALSLRVLKGSIKGAGVLILVVVDVALSRVKFHSISKFKEGLNPCCSGCGSQPIYIHQ